MSRKKPTPKVENKHITPHILVITLFNIVSRFSESMNITDDKKLSELTDPFNVMESEIKELLQIAKTTNDMLSKEIT